MEIRKFVTIVEDIKKEMGQTLTTPVKRVAAIVVIQNPFAGIFQKDLTLLEEMGGQIGGILAKMAREALGISKEECEGYGKGTIVGTGGEIEHGHAILHEKFGAPVREACGGGKAIIPGTTKVGGLGTELDIPTVYKHAFTVRSHYDSMSISVPDAPRADEILVALVITNSGRPLPRCSGLKKDDAKKEDGLR